MDPFSAGAASIGFIDVLWKLSSYLIKIQAAAKTISDEIGSFEKEIHALISINQTLEELRSTWDPDDVKSHPPKALKVWDAITKNRIACQHLVLKLEDKLRHVVDGKLEGSHRAVLVNQQKSPAHKTKNNTVATKEDESDDGKKFGEKERFPSHVFQTLETNPKKVSKTRGFGQALRKQRIDPEIANTRSQFQSYHAALEVLLASLSLIYTQHSNQESGKAIASLAQKEETYNSELRTRLNYLTFKTSSDLDGANMMEAAKVTAQPLNRFFSVPAAVKSHGYIGRTAFLEELAGFLIESRAPDAGTAQKRFVVEGLGGSGKTQFCCKFAELHRENFWGIFHINGSSRETAKESFVEIAEMGGVDRNERAAKHWLRTRSEEQPWMLIIDNADDPDVDVEGFFPEGDRGFLLINTHVVANHKHGTIGRRFFSLNELDKPSSIELLLRLAQVKAPWSESTRDTADVIAKALGYLPLCLVHAATAVAEGVCKLQDYLDSFQNAVSKLRLEFRKRKPTGKNRGYDLYLSVYSSYEMIYSKLEDTKTEEYQDAVELLKIFAFFHRQNIGLDVLEAAAAVPLLEAEAESRARTRQNNPEKKESWILLMRKVIFALRTGVFIDRGRPILPNMLRQAAQNTTGSDDALKLYNGRLRLALRVLQQWSLASHNRETDSYSIHPLIHDWVRTRPQMTLGEQAAWSQAAANTLGQSIRFHTSSPMEDNMQRSLLVHISYLRKQRDEILKTINNNTKVATPFLRNLLPFVRPTPDTVVKDRYQARQAAKFSYIYFINSRWDEAQELQEAVRDYTVPNLGGSRFNDAAILNEQILHTASRELGDLHETTLSVIDELGTIRKHQGRFPESQELLERAVEGRKRICGEDHPDTLCSIDNLGSLLWHNFQYVKAREQHMRALEGMRTHPEMGSEHEKTLTAQENLAITILEIGSEYHEEAHDLLAEVVQKRTVILGKESPWTLLALSNLAFAKHRLGRHAEAEVMLQEGLEIAIRNWGADHHGVISAQRRLAQVLTARGKYEDAEKLYKHLLDRKVYKGGLQQEGNLKGDQQARIFVLYQYVDFWEAREDFDQALKFCMELCDILRNSVHPMANLCKVKRDKLEARIQSLPRSVS
ncbi:hypothetical protein VTL71DRAFT_6693 [Oculimacula yallundae]|uniref:Kinesin light chain n=1 Tax=Oculimacula yallundae TaxID=86028 RepID=A0ABR4BYD0_9HELO